MRRGRGSRGRGGGTASCNDGQFFQGSDATVGDGFAPLGPPLLPWEMQLKRGQQQRTDFATIRPNQPRWLIR